MAQLTGKPRPQALLSADGVRGQRRPASSRGSRAARRSTSSRSCRTSFIASTQQTQGWDEVLPVGGRHRRSGGNTLNQQAIWKAQGIDEVLRQAWDRGIVLGGASAGSLCWFEEGTTDSRPKELSTVQCLGFLKGSHSPHYDREPRRRPLYQKLIGSGQMKPGYACDNDAGIYFEDNEVKRVVSHARRGEGLLRQHGRREDHREGDGGRAHRVGDPPSPAEDYSLGRHQLVEHRNGLRDSTRCAAGSRRSPASRHRDALARTGRSSRRSSGDAPTRPARRRPPSGRAGSRSGRRG